VTELRVNVEVKFHYLDEGKRTSRNTAIQGSQLVFTLNVDISTKLEENYEMVNIIDRYSLFITVIGNISNIRAAIAQSV
jgi:hypothetical protein